MPVLCNFIFSCGTEAYLSVELRPFNGPTVHFNGPTVHFNGPTVHFNGPTVHFNGPTVHFNGPTVHFNGPTVHFNGPTVHFNGPTVHSLDIRRMYVERRGFLRCIFCFFLFYSATYYDIQI